VLQGWARGRAEATLIDAEGVVTRRGEQIWIGGVLRARGDAAATRPKPDLARAESCYAQALSIARRVGAKSLELRAAKGLARVWRRQDRAREARALLQPVLARSRRASIPSISSRQRRCWTGCKMQRDCRLAGAVPCLTASAPRLKIPQ
jgi:hypothetical protein